jgi:hypothetical protein
LRITHVGTTADQRGDGAEAKNENSAAQGKNFHDVSFVKTTTALHRANTLVTLRRQGL